MFDKCKFCNIFLKKMQLLLLLLYCIIEERAVNACSVVFSLYITKDIITPKNARLTRQRDNYEKNHQH